MIDSRTGTMPWVAGTRQESRARTVPLLERMAMRIALARVIRARRAPERGSAMPAGGEPTVSPRRELPAPMC